jgi:hypothetical protein
MTIPVALMTVALAALLAAPPANARQPSFEVVPVGVRYDPDPDPLRRQTDLETIQRLRFTVVAVPDPISPGALHIVWIDRLLAGADGAPLRATAADFGVVTVTAQIAPERVREAAWTRLAARAVGVIFDGWRTLQENDAALAEAASFAEVLALNPALYAPLRRVDGTGGRAIAIAGGQDDVEARWLESSDALLLIAVNHATAPREVTLTFSPAVPEAVWQNMLTGTSVNFVAGATGPTYQRRFSAHDVLVLMIRKRWK